MFEVVIIQRLLYRSNCPENKNWNNLDFLRGVWPIICHIKFKFSFMILLLSLLKHFAILLFAVVTGIPSHFYSKNLQFFFIFY